jgi:general secretion pathway protein D
MVLYHPAHPEQLSLVRNALRDYIDTPARQIFVEGMVLEISEEGLDELGVEWEFKDGPVNLVLGTLDPTAITETLDFSTLNSRDLAYDWGLRIQALVRQGKAEVLSRPSVLTIDNRQATIRVGEDIPIATSQEGTINSNKIAFNFSYIPTGILLNIRPRMTESGDEVSMLVDTLVSAQVAGRDLEIRSSDGDLLASAPTISTRRVQTYARIANKTPFIIGGLVSRDRTVTTQKVPFLGDLPLIGNAFKSTRTSNLKREVIIVLTPYVLPEESRIITRALPKDDDLFDSTGNRLFRDSYRIRGDDVFDLRFLAENTRLKAYRQLAREVMSNNFRLAGEYPFSDFAGSNIPGEEMLVQRMVYEVIKRTRADERVNPDRIIYFEEAQSQGYQVRFLSDVLSRLGTGENATSFFERNTGKALAITYTFDRDASEVEEMAAEPIPDIALIDCPDRPTWSKLLWELNQPDALGNERYTVLLQDEKDIVRLQRAMMMKMVILLNEDGEGLNLESFRIGKILHVPAMEEDKVSVLDAEVARYFYISELYYAALIQRIERTISALDERLREPEIQMYLDGATGLPELP